MTNQNNQSYLGEISRKPSRLILSSETIKRLSSEDFDLNSRGGIILKYDDCIFVLFYVENIESYQLINILASAAQQTAGPIFATINVSNERRIVEAIAKLKSDNHLDWTNIKQFPFILIFRKGKCLAVYNDPYEIQSIIDYALTLACESGYFERETDTPLLKEFY